MSPGPAAGGSPGARGEAGSLTQRGQPDGSRGRGRGTQPTPVAQEGLAALPSSLLSGPPAGQGLPGVAADGGSLQAQGRAEGSGWWIWGGTSGMPQPSEGGDGSHPPRRQDKPRAEFPVSKVVAGLRRVDTLAVSGWQLRGGPSPLPSQSPVSDGSGRRAEVPSVLQFCSELLWRCRGGGGVGALESLPSAAAPPARPPSCVPLCPTPPDTSFALKVYVQKAHRFHISLVKRQRYLCLKTTRAGSTWQSARGTAPS